MTPSSDHALARSGGELWMLAVQWHPEDEIESALFRGFAEAIR